MAKHRAQLLLMSESISREELVAILQHAVEWAYERYHEDYHDAIKAFVIDDMEDED